MPQSSPTVLITGASTGIGRTTALLLDRRGWRVFAGVRKDADADALRAASSDRLTPVLLDVTNADHIVAAVETVSARVGEAGLDGLVNNAGIVVPGPLEYVSIDDLFKQFEVNVIAQVAVTQAFLPLIRRAGGRIVTIGSDSGRVALPLIGPYAMSKFALEAFSDALRRELMPWGLHVALIEPGNIRTPMWDKAGSYAGQHRPSVSPEAEAHYGDLMDLVAARLPDAIDRALDPGIVAQIVHHALTAPRPRTRYLVGMDARMFAVLAWLLPDRVFDWLVRVVMR